MKPTGHPFLEKNEPHSPDSKLPSTLTNFNTNHHLFSQSNNSNSSFNQLKASYQKKNNNNNYLRLSLLNVLLGLYENILLLLLFFEM